MFLDFTKQDPSFFHSVPQNLKSAVATVSFRKRITSIDSVFTQACESIRVSGAKMAFVVVEEKVTNRMEDLFDHHKISLVTNEQFIETLTNYRKSNKGNL